MKLWYNKKTMERKKKMALKELEIVKIREMIEDNSLKIPFYQRPYRWEKKTAITMFYDIKRACEEEKKEYRMGTVILHKDKKECGYNIVDGQQRLTTLGLLYYCLTGETSSLFYQNYNTLSEEAIIENYVILKQKVADLGEQKEVYTKYLLENCTLVKIVTNKEQEAFQFFDSQNARGKSLYPHDLLKAYHLREIAEQNKKQKEQGVEKTEEEQKREKEKLIEEWEEISEEKLEILFADRLFPILQWKKGKNGLYYNSKKIEAFKGIKTTASYPYVTYHCKIENQFQLTQPIMAGKGFFNYVLYYYKMWQYIEEKVEKSEYQDFCREKGSGYRYTKNLFINASMLFVDRFGEENLTDSRLQILFKWAYSLRIVMPAIYQETMNNYAIGKKEINQDLNLFEKISEMKRPEELEMITLETVKEEMIKSRNQKNQDRSRRKELYHFIFMEKKEKKNES